MRVAAIKIFANIGGKIHTNLTEKINRFISNSYEF